MIRKMISSDIPSVHRINTSAMNEEYLPEVFSYFLLQWPEGQIVSCDYIGNINGFISGARLGDGKVTISLFAVDQKERGKGIGSELLSAFKHSATMEGKNIIRLEVRLENHSAIKYYEKRGFVKVQHLPSFYNDGGDAFCMISSFFRET